MQKQWQLNYNALARYRSDNVALYLPLRQVCHQKCFVSGFLLLIIGAGKGYDDWHKNQWTIYNGCDFIVTWWANLMFFILWTRISPESVPAALWLPCYHVHNHSAYLLSKQRCSALKALPQKSHICAKERLRHKLLSYGSNLSDLFRSFFIMGGGKRSIKLYQNVHIKIDSLHYRSVYTSKCIFRSMTMITRSNL